MLAVSQVHERERGSPVDWDVRSLQAFGNQSLTELARSYDLLVIDHPHVGDARASGSLLPLDEHLAPQAIAQVQAGAMEACWHSYRYADHQWALPIDASAQVAAWSRGWGTSPPDCGELIELARADALLWPLSPIDALASLLTLAANLEGRAGESRDELPATPELAQALDLMAGVAAHLPPASFSMSAIDALEALADATQPARYCPLVFGYAAYAAPAYRARVVDFADAPLPAGQPGDGALLGGAGIAVSSLSGLRREALDFVERVANPVVQATAYLEGGGQPAAQRVWMTQSGEALGSFYEATHRSIEHSYTRPRHPGFVAFKTVAGHRLRDGLATGEDPQRITAALIELYDAHVTLPASA